MVNEACREVDKMGTKLTKFVNRNNLPRHYANITQQIDAHVGNLYESRAEELPLVVVKPKIEVVDAAVREVMKKKRLVKTNSKVYVHHTIRKSLKNYARIVAKQYD